MARKYPERRTRRLLIEYPRAVPLALFLLVAAITGLSVYAIETGESERERSELRERAKAIASAVERRGNSSAAYLRAGAALFGSSEDIEPLLFQSFVTQLQLDSDFRGAEGIGWARRLRLGEIEAFEERVSTFVPGDFAVFPRPPADRTHVVPITYLQPDTERSRRALGFDMYSEPVRRKAMDEAERSTRPTATGKIVLIQEGTGSDPGFLIYMPVFQEGRTPRRLKGFIYSPFRAQEFLFSALELEGRGEKGVRLYDGIISPDRLLAEVPPDVTTGVTMTQSVRIAQRDMVLEIESSLDSSLSTLSMITLLFGLLVATLLMVVARLLTHQALEDRAALDWFEEQNSIRNSLTRELNHRVKNTLANVLSIVALTRRRADSLDSFAESLDGRIRALSATHDLLTKSEWGTTPIRDVVQAELAPYARHDDNILDLCGDEVALAPNDALSLGLAIHELATNAAKYGALSAVGGKILLTWSLVGPDKVRLEWIESGGPPVATKEERARGFGTELIEKIVAHELRHPVTLEFRPDGVRCEIFVPVRRPSDFRMRVEKRPG
ncbi:CHASE domain-containing protein [Parerythrobacter lacustris]|uniref:histidine kinase n=1 Tax=Parerythrobacter lacustris TaxID=2969984 RepID=A0ABT1XM43_9SPHN|nr:CHASE domain-containing protein [Parerythrobacter lacustris]